MSSVRRATATLGAVACATAAALIGVVTTSSSASAAPAPGVSYKFPASAGAFPSDVLRPGQYLVGGSAATNNLGSETLPDARHYVDSFPPFELVLQGDGNLVEYEVSPATHVQTARWATYTTTGARLMFQTDHNLVLRDAAGKALWATGTAGSTAAYFSLYGNGQLALQDAAGHPVALVGPAITPAPGAVVGESASPGGEFVLLQQTDGNLVEYQRVRTGLRPLWSTRTVGAGAIRLIAQSDGNLVLRSAGDGHAVWASGSHGPTGYYQLDVQDDANVVLYRTDGLHRLNAVWASHTHL